jgi:hypothetical protein
MLILLMFDNGLNLGISTRLFFLFFIFFPSSFHLSIFFSKHKDKHIQNSFTRQTATTTMVKRGRDDDYAPSSSYSSSRPPPSARPSTPPPTSLSKGKAKGPLSPASSTLSSPPSSPPTPPSFKLVPSPTNTYEPMDWCTTAWYLIDWMDWYVLLSF